MPEDIIRATSEGEFEQIQRIWKGFAVLNQLSSLPLHIKWSPSPVQTIELDLDSLYDAGHPSWGFIAQPLGKFAAENSSVISTIYAYDTPSVNWGYHHNAVFFGVIERNKDEILNIILLALRSIRSETDQSEKLEPAKARMSTDFVSFKKEQARLHVEDGKIWRPNDIEETWYHSPSWVP